MKSTIDIAKECNFSFAKPMPLVVMCSIDELEAFRKAVEAEFVSRCDFAAYRITHLDGSYELDFLDPLQKVKFLQKLYTLPTITE